MAKQPTTAAGFRKRADDIGKGLKFRTPKDRAPLRRRQKALNDMADNEDWLDGKPASAAKE
ncbi:MAG: hypothetical protein E6G97_09290 [Alphaproteobacteria bacterium]|nr:MAG: hypothetical protein E6G97_09290 [Alphaproteobacteria bacterium]